MVHASELAETNEFIIGRMLVREDVSIRSDVLPNHIPRAVGVLAPGDPRDGLAALPTFADGHYDHAVRRLVFRKATVYPFLLTVFRADMPEGIKPVDLDFALKHGVVPPGRQSLSELHQVGPGRLVLDPDLTAEFQHRLALGPVGRERDDCEDLAEGKLPGGEDRP